MKTNSSFFMFVLTLLILSGLSCKNDLKVEQSNNSYFHRGFSLALNQKCFSISQTDDNGFLIIGSQDGYTFNDQNAVAIIKTDRFGNMEWNKTIESDTFFVPCISQQKDGSFLIAPTTEGRNIYKLDKNGNQLFKKSFSARNPAFDFYSFPTQKANGEIVFAASNQTNGNFGDFIILDNLGQFKRLVPINKGTLNLADHICVYKLEDTSTYYYYGIEIFYAPTPKIFIGKQTIFSLKRKLIVDSKNLSDANLTNEVELRHLLLDDGSVILYNTPLEAKGHHKGYIALIDNDLNKVWDMDLRIGANGTNIYNMNLCADGNYLISGACKMTDKLFTQPFACKIDPKGKIIWQKIFTTKYSGAFNCGIQLGDGSYVFGGTSNGYGDGQNANDIFILKTDKDGNLD